MTEGESSPAPVLFSNPEEGPTVVDTNSPVITAIVKGQELLGTVIDGGSGVNVISLRTCDALGIHEWEPCPFWLRMADTSSVRPTGLIRKLEVTVGGHTFHISVVVLQLQAQGAYPPFARPTMVENSTHQTELEKKCDYLPARKS